MWTRRWLVAVALLAAAAGAQAASSAPGGRRALNTLPPSQSLRQLRQETTVGGSSMQCQAACEHLVQGWRAARGGGAPRTQGPAPPRCSPTAQQARNPARSLTCPPLQVNCTAISPPIARCAEALCSPIFQLRRLESGEIECQRVGGCPPARHARHGWSNRHSPQLLPPSKPLLGCSFRPCSWHTAQTPAVMLPCAASAAAWCRGSVPSTTMVALPAGLPCAAPTKVAHLACMQILDTPVPPEGDIVTFDGTVEDVGEGVPQRAGLAAARAAGQQWPPPPP